jgi:hypothetical protein
MRRGLAEGQKQGGGVLNTDSLLKTTYSAHLY